MNKQRRTSNINNVVTYDTSNNVTVPASLTQGFVLSSLLKSDANGKIIAATSGTDFQSPLILTTLGTSGAATLIGSTLNIPQYAAGSGTVNYVTKWSTSSTLGDSLIYDNGTNVSIGTTSPDTTNKLQIEGKMQSNSTTSSLSTSVYSVVGNSTAIWPAGTVGTMVVTNGAQGGTTYQIGGNVTIPNSTVTSALVAVSGIQFTGTGTVTVNQADSGIRSMANIFAMWSRSGSISGTVTHMSNIRVVTLYSPPSGATLTVTNYYAILIENSSQFSPILITNKWGIYQEGPSDNNYFAGKVLIGSPSLGSSIFKISGLPTSSTGLSPGDVWNDGGTLKIV